jgi:hypothetical protein
VIIGGRGRREAPASTSVGTRASRKRCGEG